MTWTACKIVFRLLSPMHIGWIKQGNLQRTRPYATGKALWGALTARLTRDFPELGGDYCKVGERVNQELAFSYFYPAVSDNVDLWPWENPDEFAWRYLGSYAGTALDYGRNTAEEGSLHETEFIASRTRDGWPVYLVGYIFECQGCTLLWQDVLSRLQLGGERTYGWGRVQLESKSYADGELFGYKLELEGDRPVLTIPAGEFLRAHALASDGEGKALHNMHGTIEPFLGRETRAANRFGEAFSEKVQICWTPGSQARAEVRVRIGEHGIWERTA